MPGKARKQAMMPALISILEIRSPKGICALTFRDKQVHISGDVAMAMWEYFKLTGDDSLLLEGGAEVILECARFYYSYAYFKKDKNRYEILDVIGPDEYHERVNNNAFTSMVAKATFEIANAAVNYLKQKHPDELNALVKKDWNCR